MEKQHFSPATHFCIVWGITLAVFSLLEWNSLGRNPVEQEIMSPFIGRRIEVFVEEAATTATEKGSIAVPEESPDALLRYEVEFSFNGPLFLAFFFGPMAAFQGLGWVWSRIRGA